jgi:hypothetical protein
MAKLTKETREKINAYILNAINSEDVQLNTTEEKLKYALKRFYSEYGHEIKRCGEHKAFANWLQGLPSAFNIDFYNDDILKIATEWGQDVTTERQQQYILNSWWDFISNNFFKLCRKHKIEVE